MSEQSIRDELAQVIAVGDGARGHMVIADDELMADQIMASSVIRRIQAQAIRGAALKAQDAFVAEWGGIGYARVRTDWFHREANRIEAGDV